MALENLVTSIEDLIGRIRSDTAGWKSTHPRWFRGEPETNTPLLPRLYRKLPYPNENPLLQNFRIMAPSFAETTPPRDDTDKWLCLAQHVRLPTRLLDWTENALLALFFAVQKNRPVVWMLNPIELNVRSISYRTARKRIRESGEFPITWIRPRPPEPLNAVAENIAGAWELDQAGVGLPVAFVPPYVHPRMAAQQSRFTIHGKKKVGLSALLPQTVLKSYRIDSKQLAKFREDLRMLGVGHATAFPDLDGLAKELTTRYAPGLI